MKTILIYDKSDYQYESEVTVVEFESKEKMVEFINAEKIGKRIIASYEIYKEIKIKPVEIEVKWVAES